MQLYGGHTPIRKLRLGAFFRLCPVNAKRKTLYTIKGYILKFNLDCCNKLWGIMENESEINLAGDYMWHSYCAVVGVVFPRYDCGFRCIDNRLWFASALAEKSDRNRAWNS